MESRSRMTLRAFLINGFADRVTRRAGTGIRLRRNGRGDFKFTARVRIGKRTGRVSVLEGKDRDGTQRRHDERRPDKQTGGPGALQVARRPPVELGFAEPSS